MSEILNWRLWIFPVFLSLLLFAVNEFSFLLFHTLAELFAIIIAFLLFSMAWRTNIYTDNRFLLYLACGYFWIGGLDIVHTLAYEGMNLLPNGGANMASQFWIVTRYFEAIVLLTAALLMKVRFQPLVLLGLFGLVSVIFTGLIFGGWFPTTFVNGTGLTQFKILSEYCIIALLAASMVLIWQKRNSLRSEGILLIMLSIMMTIFGEIAFTQYVTVYAPSNKIGHIFKLFSSWLMFQAIVVENLRKPYKDLIQSEQYNRYLFESSPVGLVFSRMNGEIQDINTACAQILGRPVEELKGMTSRDITADDVIGSKVNQVNPPVEKLLLNSKGEKIPVSVSSRRIERNGEWFILSAVEDISERKKTEAKVKESNEFFRVAFENTAVGNLMIDEKGTIQLFNTAAEQIFGYQAQEVIGRHIDVLLPEVMKTGQRSCIQQFLQSLVLKEKPVECLMSGTRKHGEKFNLGLVAGVAQRGEKHSLIISVRDLTEFEKMEKQLLQSQKMEAVGQLTGGIAHDFNNLLQVLSASVDLLNDKTARETRFDELLEKMARSISRGSALTQHLLAFSRQQALSPVSVEVNALIDEIREMLARTVGAEIVLQTALAANAWQALVDPGQLEHAILNLSINARDAMPDGGTLTIATQNITLDAALATRLSEVSPGDYVKVSVTDTGTGMSEEVISMVFEPFFTTKPTGKGTGLGLSMVFGFIKQSGGHVSIESELGKGTSVSLFIPRCLAAPVREHAQSAVEPMLTQSGNERVLVVEDEELVRELSVMMLSDAGYQVTSVENGPLALAAMRDNQPFDLLFTDLSLTGGMNGKQVAEAAMRLQPQLKVLYTSGYAHQEMSGKVQLDAGDMVIEKPYRAAALLKKVRSVLDLPAA